MATGIFRIFHGSYDKQEQDRIKDRSPQWVTTIRSRQGPSLDNREAGRSQPETTQILVANQTQRCRSKERARPKDQHAKRPITYQGPRSLRYILYTIIPSSLSSALRSRRRQTLLETNTTERPIGSTTTHNTHTTISQIETYAPI